MTFLRINDYNEDWTVYRAFGGQQGEYILLHVNFNNKIS